MDHWKKNFENAANLWHRTKSETETKSSQLMLDTSQNTKNKRTRVDIVGKKKSHKTHISGHSKKPGKA